MSCGKRPLNRDGSRPQWHKDDFPWMEDEAYNRPVTPDEFIQKRDAYMKEKSKQADQWIWVIVALILLFSIRWDVLLNNPAPSTHQQHQQRGNHQ